MIQLRPNRLENEDSGPFYMGFQLFLINELLHFLVLIATRYIIDSGGQNYALTRVTNDHFEQTVAL